ncbi:MAG: hypothetical protein ACLR93_03530 [Alistipes onderdonkii]
MILTDVAFVCLMFSVTELAPDDAIVMLRVGFGPRRVRRPRPRNR